MDGFLSGAHCLSKRVGFINWMEMQRKDLGRHPLQKTPGTLENKQPKSLQLATHNPWPIACLLHLFTRPVLVTRTNIQPRGFGFLAGLSEFSLTCHGCVAKRCTHLVHATSSCGILLSLFCVCVCVCFPCPLAQVSTVFFWFSGGLKFLRRHMTKFKFPTRIILFGVCFGHSHESNTHN